MFIVVYLFIEMKKKAALLMSFMFLFQGMARDMDLCEQIELVSNFISHYQDHAKVHGDTFFEYVAEDYLSSESDNGEHHPGSDNHQSPAHSTHQCCHPLVFITATNLFTLRILKSDIKQKFDIYTFQINSRFQESLFQPPQV